MRVGPVRNAWKGLFVMSLLCGGGPALAQDVYPPFNVAPLTVQVPRAVPGYQADPGNEQGDSAVYDLNGQLFPDDGSGGLQTLAEGFSGVSPRTTPWETLTELLAAYQSQDEVKLRSLYDTDAETNAFFDEFWATESLKSAFLAQAATVTGLDVRLGFEDAGGFFVFSRGEPADTWGMVSFFLVLDAGDYKLRAHSGSNQAMQGNISQFLEFDPGQITAATIPFPVTSLERGQEVELELHVGTAGSWGTLFVPVLDSQVLASTEDGSAEDTHPVAGRINLLLRANDLDLGPHTILAVESDYVLTFVTQSLIDAGTSMSITVAPAP